mmetsp:Transcript_17180/g.23741  ORF Transcript_17180/g.23741 Transcript_17180/m.23741 type:complete len:212 (+) Transcript_17180:329-964(+)|eukprot:CAMPEP_0196599470 /NCGR_PEP_ID=MMETSP1081-20130531/94873_1 /TAXON_ID=36882 /ORGANISM="Pyramimonas amylifera, Strain CCMP720" /LENGTH=211 /DNA_ID=CAMNT_0041925241 /DNA_START=165 /DNA_END=800 /DNA_ORIENTATION=+
MALFARLRRKKVNPALTSASGETGSTSLLISQLATLAPGLMPSHVHFAEKYITSLGMDRSALKVPEIQQLFHLAGLNPTLDSIEQLLQESGQEASSVQNIRVFLSLWSKYLSSSHEERLLTQAFTFFDRNGDGSISTQEFEEVMTELGDKLTREECQLFIKLIDKDGDDQVQFGEFLSALKKDSMAGIMNSESVKALGDGHPTVETPDRDK